jgi:hypothetical protein
MGTIQSISSASVTLSQQTIHRVVEGDTGSKHARLSLLGLFKHFPRAKVTLSLHFTAIQALRNTFSGYNGAVCSSRCTSSSFTPEDNRGPLAICDSDIEPIYNATT